MRSRLLFPLPALWVMIGGLTIYNYPEKPTETTNIAPSIAKIESTKPALGLPLKE